MSYTCITAGASGLILSIIFYIVSLYFYAKIVIELLISMQSNWSNLIGIPIKFIHSERYSFRKIDQMGWFNSMHCCTYTDTFRKLEWFTKFHLRLWHCVRTDFIIDMVPLTDCASLAYIMVLNPFITLVDIAMNDILEAWRKKNQIAEKCSKIYVAYYIYLM